MVERIACWSVRHRKTAVVGWLAFVAVAYIIGQSFGGSSVQQYDPGQAGQAEQMMHQLKVVTPPAESVLIAARGHTAASRAQVEAEVRQVADEVARALAALPHHAAADIHAPSARGGTAADLGQSPGRHGHLRRGRPERRRPTRPSRPTRRRWPGSRPSIPG